MKSFWLTAALSAAVLLGVLAPVLKARAADKAAMAELKKNKALQELVAASAKEGVLNIFGSGDWNDPKLIGALEKGLNATYGLNVKLNVTPGPSASNMQPRLVDEYKTGRTASTDVFFAPSRQQLPTNQAGVLTHVDWKKYMPQINDEEIGQDGSSVVVGAAIHVIGYNTNIFKKSDLPKTYADFANPKYKGKIGTTKYAVGWVEAAIYLGEQKAMDLVKTMVKNGSIVGVTVTGAQDRVATGEFPMFAFDTTPASYTRLKQKGAPVDIATLDNFLSGTANSASVPKNSGHPNLATLLSLYLLTDEGQQIAWDVIGRNSPFRAGSNLNKFVEAKKKAGATIYFATDKEVQKNLYYYSKVGRALAKVLRGG
jgi:iron(III) transport system substrate-binding protein